MSTEWPRATSIAEARPNLLWRSDVMNPTCSVEGCERPVRWRGYCRPHYDRWRKYGSTDQRPRHLGGFGRGPLAPRFWSKVRKTDGCWEWISPSVNDGGYGMIWVAERGRMIVAHRVSWELHNGPIPDGLFVLHRCDNPPCVRPDHLFLGTKLDNARDMAVKGRSHGTGGRWAVDWDKCIDCGSTARRHTGKGLCSACRPRRRARAERRAREDAGLGPGAVAFEIREEPHTMGGSHQSECPRCRKVGAA